MLPLGIKIALSLARARTEKGKEKYLLPFRGARGCSLSLSLSLPLSLSLSLSLFCVPSVPLISRASGRSRRNNRELC